MADNIRWGLDNPHPFSKMKTELIWEGKYDEYGNRRAVDVAGNAMPLQKIETVDQPRSEAAASGQIEIFEKENKRLDDFRNMLVWGDNKLVMASLLRDFKGKIDLIYIDPPFDVGADFKMSIPLGDEKETVEKDQSALEMVAYRDMWGKGTDSYLHMMYERFLLARELLSEQGSIYVHCDWHVSNFLKSILGEIFGSENFLNCISWCYRGYEHNRDHWNRKHDDILYYAKTKDKLYFNCDAVSEQLSDVTIKKYKYKDDKDWYRIRGRNIKGSPFKQQTDLSPEIEKKYPHLIYRQYKGEGTLPRDWFVLDYVNQAANEKLDFQTQKPEALIKRFIKASSNEGDLVADFFCGSGTTGAVAEKLGRRWIMADLGRFAIHTSRKRLIETQRKLYKENKPYRSFGVYNLGRYERQWWQKERLQGADEEHRRVVMEFYRAESLPNPTGLLHGRKGQAFVHVDNIDSIFTREELRAVVKSAREVGAQEIHCLAWEFEMDLRLVCHELEAAEGVKIKLIPIPREIMEKNRKNPPPFLEVAVLAAEPVYHEQNGKHIVDIKLTKFLPSLAEVPSKELEVLKERAIKSGFDFIDFWAVDFEWHEGKPFEHHWQDYRTRKDRSLKTVSTLGYDKYSEKEKYTACVKVIDVFGCDTSITVEVKI